MAYTTIDKSSLHFNTKLYTGNGSTNAITGVGFQPDWTWIKHRGATHDHNAYDVVRGVTKMITPNANYAESTVAASLTSFDSDGFTLGNVARSNANGGSLVSWNWKAGNSQGSSNTDGSINTTYTSVNTTAGFSISKYTGTGANATVGHGLGVAPKVIIVKNLENSYEWIIGHKDLASGGTGFSGNWYFNGFGTGVGNQNATASWNSTNPSATVFSLHASATYMNASGQSNIAYCFAEKTGYSKFGSYTGNGNANGTFVYTGFKPAWLLIKRAVGSAAPFCIFDNKRDGYNPNKLLLASNTNVESSANFDILSNGFKTRTTDGEWNGSGNTYVYMAFAEAPLVGSNNVPCTAR